jgi:hypothetical protein
MACYIDRKDIMREIKREVMDAVVEGWLLSDGVLITLVLAQLRCVVVAGGRRSCVGYQQAQISLR